MLTTTMWLWMLLLMLMSGCVVVLADNTGLENEDPVEHNCTRSGQPCKNGIILPAWRPLQPRSTGEMVGRAMVYLFFLLYLFLGVSIISERFMSAIEVITSQEREVVVREKGSREYKVTVRVWNETVSNLTLMALGSSAPEILLSIIEIIGNNFKAGDLGPGTIVGSAAYNLFVIVAVCIVVIPGVQVRRIRHIVVFWATVLWSMFAYIWLYLILAVISKGRVDWWEGLLTLLFFPLTVINSYICDTQLFKFGSRTQKRVTGPQKQKTFIPHPSQVSSNGLESGQTNPSLIDSVLATDVKDYESTRRIYIDLFKELRAQNPDADINLLEELARAEMLKRMPKSRAFYRIQATRRITGQGDITKAAAASPKKSNRLRATFRSKSNDETSVLFKPQKTVYVRFDPGHYTCMEDCGSIKLNVVCDRHGIDTQYIVMVDYQSQDDSAKEGEDYLKTHGSLRFYPDETSKLIEVPILDNNIYEEDEQFFVNLLNPRLQPYIGGKKQLSSDSADFSSFVASETALKHDAQLGIPSTATILILDNDHAGLFQFETGSTEVHESAGSVHLRVTRSKGCRGVVKIPYQTIDGSAKADLDYLPTSGTLIFEDDQAEKLITVPIVDDDQYEKSEFFYVELGEPEWEKPFESDEHKKTSIIRSLRKTDAAKPIMNKDELKIAEEGRPLLGGLYKCRVTIIESKEFKNFVDRVLRTNKTAFLVGTHSWKQQFVNAIKLEAEGGPKPSCLEYTIHYFSLPWKLFFSIVPPTDYFSGWACFVVSICLIGLLTALIGDAASHFGCTIGLKDAVTAISLVALGTSLPDTFASKVAAVNDAYADSSIVNVTGSNAVNVFLGLGVAWSIASIYHAIKGTVFYVDPGNLAFSVTMFCVGAVIAIALLQFRRYFKPISGELGGPTAWRWTTFSVFVGVWVIYLLLSSLEAYCYIPSFAS